MNILFIGVGCGFGGYAAYSLFTSACSDTLGLKTLRHGTGPYNYLSIQFTGARPDVGGKAAGEATLRDYSESRHTENKFFVWEDDYYKKGNVSHPSKLIRALMNCRVLHPFVKRVGPKYYTIQNGVAAATVKRAPKPIRVFFQVLGGIGGLFTPVLDFHVTPQEFQENFTLDPGLESTARFTRKPLSSWKYIGLTGTLYQGINREVFARIKQNPERFIKGIAKMLILAVLVSSILSILSMYMPILNRMKVNVYSWIAQKTHENAVFLSLAAGLALPVVGQVIA